MIGTLVVKRLSSYKDKRAYKDKKLCRVITCLIREYISWWNDVVGLENKQSIITTKKLYTEVSMDTMQSRVCWP